MAPQHRQRGFIQSSWFSGPCLALVVMTLMCAAASTTSAQQQPPPLPLPTLPQPTTTPAIPSVPACPPALATLSPCVSYLIGNSTSPPTECCAQIRAMFQSQAPCLCAAMASGPVQQLGSALGQLLPSSCDLPADACSGGTSSATPTDPMTPAASGTTPAAPAPATEPNGLDDPTAPAGGAGIKSVPGLVHSAAAAGSTSGISAAALFMSLLVVYPL
ncbi:non-specific lipid transfer protein GPI-anchored 15-like [Miscanthus floridulus]|uniref:non-specific lipid transfer protein GPI-anchored 15-like n=1 Tax=Miscanthus floridulus TaxID=154761 RepID=UPI00345A93EA